MDGGGTESRRFGRGGDGDRRNRGGRDCHGGRLVLVPLVLVPLLLVPLLLVLLGRLWVVPVVRYHDHLRVVSVRFVHAYIVVSVERRLQNRIVEEAVGILIRPVFGDLAHRAETAEASVASVRLHLVSKIARTPPREMVITGFCDVVVHFHRVAWCWNPRRQTAAVPG